MARQKVTVLNEFPEFTSDEPRLSNKQRLRAQTEAQLSREERELQSEYDSVIASASGPLASDWTERWNAHQDRRRELLRVAPLAQQAQQLAEQYITPTMVLAPGQSAPVHDGSYIAGSRYPIRFSALGGSQVRSARNVRVEAGQEYTVTVGDRQPVEAQLRPDRNGDVWPVTISGELRVETDPVTGERGQPQTFYFAPPETIGRHTRLNDDGTIAVNSATGEELTAEQREAILVNGWQSPVPGFGEAQNGVQDANRRIRGLRSNAVIIDEVGGEPIFTPDQVRRARQAGRNNRYWQSLLQQHPAPQEPAPQESRRVDLTPEEIEEGHRRLMASLTEASDTTRQAANSVNEFTRALIREESWARHNLPPNPIQNEPIPEALHLHADNPTPVFHDLGDATFIGTPRSTESFVMEAWGGGGPSSLKKTVEKAVAPPKPQVRRKQVIVWGPDEL